MKPLQRVVAEMGFSYPTLIQEMTIPIITTGRDVLASSITGSGKTAAFLLPLIQKFYKIKYNNALGNFTKALIVCPTRELAVQCYEWFSKLNKYTNLTHALVIGKVPLQKQEAEVRRGPDLIIATPGRMTDLLKNSKSFNLDDLEMLIFDEADKLLSMGFKAEVEEIVQNVNKNRQTLLFSATLDDDVQTLVKLALNKPLRIQANPDNRVAAKLSQEVVLIESEYDRQAALVHLLLNEISQRCIIFFRTKKECHAAAILLGVLGKTICELHGNMSQVERVQAFEDFRAMKFDVMLATDLAARGLDIKNLQYVVNYELPRELTRYIHRIGRTARAGESGTCVTIVTRDELKLLKKMVKSTKDKLTGKKIAASDIAAAKILIERAGNDVNKIEDEETVERELRLAEMEAIKAENMLKYREDIYSKPRREWVVSEKIKNKIRSESNPWTRNEDEGGDKEDNTDHRDRRSHSRGGREDRADHSRGRSGDRGSRGGRGGHSRDRSGDRGSRGGRGGREDRGGYSRGRSGDRGSRGSRGRGGRSDSRTGDRGDREDRGSRGGRDRGGRGGRGGRGSRDREGGRSFDRGRGQSRPNFRGSRGNFGKRPPSRGSRRH